MRFEPSMWACGECCLNLCPFFLLLSPGLEFTFLMGLKFTYHISPISYVKLSTVNAKASVVCHYLRAASDISRLPQARIYFTLVRLVAYKSYDSGYGKRDLVFDFLLSTFTTNLLPTPFSQPSQHPILHTTYSHHLYFLSDTYPPHPPSLTTEPQTRLLVSLPASSSLNQANTNRHSAPLLSKPCRARSRTRLALPLAEPSPPEAQRHQPSQPLPK